MPTPPSTPELGITTKEARGVVVLVGRRTDHEEFLRAGDLLDARGVFSFVLWGVGLKLIVSHEDAPTARHILRVDPLCGKLHIPDDTQEVARAGGTAAPPTLGGP